MKIIRLLFFCLLLGVTSLLADSQLKPIQASDNLSQQFTLLPAPSSEKTQVLRIYYSNQSEINTLAHSLDIWEVHQTEGFIVAAVSSAEVQWLDVAGYRYEVDVEKTALLLAPTAPLDARFYYFDNNFVNPNGLYIVNFLQDTNAAYPNLTELVDIGDAWQASHGGHARDMWVLRITNEDPTYGNVLDKPAFFLMAEIHAREVATPELAIRYIRYLTSGFDSQGGYGLDPDVTWMVNHHVVYVLVMQNPDGHVVDEADTNAMWRKNLNYLDGCTAPNPFGVDLNRNHSFLWGCCGGSTGDPCDETYRGNSEASEPETQAFQDYIMTVIPDQNGPNDNWTIAPASPITTTGFFISMHSYADDILWPWFLPGYPDAPNQAQHEGIGRKIASIDTYYSPNGTIGYTVDGSANYWTYGKLGIPAFTFEVGPNYGSCGGFFPAFGCIDGIDAMPRDFWAENRPVFIYATKIARQPYLNAFGPDTQNVVVSPAMVSPGTPVDLTANVADHRYGGDPLTPITAAEFFIDSPGMDGTGITMSPSDGSWGGTNENVQVVVDTTGLSDGQHYLLVHGKNNQDEWGPFTAVFLTIANPDFGVILDPASAGQHGYPGWHADYHLLLTNLGNGLDTFTIQVSGTWTVTAPVSVGPLSPSSGEEITITVSVPPAAQPGDADISTIIATSQGDPDQSAQSILTTTARHAGPAVSPMEISGNGNPGEYVTYTLVLTNNNYLPDTFYPEIQSIWATELTPSPIGPVPPDQSVSIQVTVSIPMAAPAFSSDIATLTFPSTIPAIPPAVATLTTSANTVYGMDVIADPTSQVANAEGIPVTYTLYITNTGNITDSYNLFVTSDWEVDYPLHTPALSMGESIAIPVVVYVPVGIPSGTTNTTTVTIIPVGDPMHGHQLVLTTNTFWYSLYLPFTIKR